MIDTNSQKYKTASNIISNLRDVKNDWDWDRIDRFDTDSPEALEQKLSAFFSMSGFPDFTAQEWHEIVKNEKENEEYGKDTTITMPSVIIPDADDHDYQIHTEKGSAWASYKQILFTKHHFDKDTVNMIQSSSIRILNKLSLDTRESGPVKGLVIGNVQSGKTANMAAVMAMAADQGWNMFIVLSGTIENLRIQTQERLIGDLNSASNVDWHAIDNVETDSSFIYALQKLNLGPNRKERYLTICLKHSTRMKNLLTWLKKDLKAREQLKILFIDDEADQAGVNTAKPKKGEKPSDEMVERTAINRCLANLLTNKDADGNVVASKFAALDYVAYTATPYANVLNEKPGPASIYPSNFVSCLAVSDNYFGPQVIFGIEGQDYDGLDIVNEISTDEVSIIKQIYKGEAQSLPEELQKAIFWFYCCFAIRRHEKINEPVSMLIHTSQRQQDHEKLTALIRSWITSLSPIDFVKKCESVYKEQTTKFTLSDFHENLKKYSSPVKDYPAFKDITNDLLFIVNQGVKSIKIDEEGDPQFNKGVNLCIDNCAHNIIENGDEHIRLIYPKKEKKPDFTTGFIVVGGATLSRGLTIEGLVSSYFLRTVKQADTLMQMGRWFGYRIGYELLPRIWVTNNTKNQFRFLSLLDYELRMEMKYMEDSGIKPSLVGVKIRNNPKHSFIEVTSKYKEKDAELVDVDFGGIATQTTIFFESEDKLKANFDATSEFLNKIGASLTDADLASSHCKATNSLIWTHVTSDNVIDYLSKLQFPKNDTTFLDLKLFKAWYSKISNENGLLDWNVVAAGVDNAKPSDFVPMGALNVCRVNRSRKKADVDDGKIRIGALRSMKDIYVDIDLNAPGLTTEDKNLISKSNSDKYKIIRNDAGLNKTSLLIVYVIDHDSQPRENVKHRVAMGTINDVIGITLVIPQDDSKPNGGSHISIRIEPEDNPIDEVDIDDENSAS
jgi:hypothetical protein